jgi:hypothetical protein
MIELLFLFTIKVTALFFFNMLWRSAVRSSGLQQNTPYQRHRLKTRCFYKGDLVGEPLFRPKLTSHIMISHNISWDCPFKKAHNFF